MNKLAIALFGLTLASSIAFAAAAEQQPSQAKPSGTYYWLHPKLGMVKVDRATGFMVRAEKKSSRTLQPASASKS